MDKDRTSSLPTPLVTLSSPWLAKEILNKGARDINVSLHLLIGILLLIPKVDFGIFKVSAQIPSQVCTNRCAPPNTFVSKFVFQGVC